MSWGDDVRCLYCDGRLPLYRKLTDGQFCSAAHRKGYWVEQQRLGVERLRDLHIPTGIPAPHDSVDEPSVPDFAAEIPHDLVEPELVAGPKEANAHKMGGVARPAKPGPIEADAAAAIWTHLSTHTEIDPHQKIVKKQSRPKAAPRTKPSKTPAVPDPILRASAAELGMPLVGWVARPPSAAIAPNPAILAADPLEYEMGGSLLRPVGGSANIQRPSHDLREAGLQAVPFAPVEGASIASSVEFVSDPRPQSPALPSSGIPAESKELSAAGPTRVPVNAASCWPDASKRAAPVRFPATFASLPVLHARPAGEMEDAIGALIPPFETPLRYAPIGASEWVTPSGDNLVPSPVSFLASGESLLPNRASLLQNRDRKGADIEPNPSLLQNRDRKGADREPGPARDQLARAPGKGADTEEPHSANVDAVLAHYTVRPEMPVRARRSSKELFLAPLAALEFGPVESQPEPLPIEIAAITELPELEFASPSLSFARTRLSVGFAPLLPVLWNPRDAIADWHSPAVRRTAPEEWGSAIELLPFDPARPVASLRGSAQQRKLAFIEIRDEARTRQASVPRVYFAPQPAAAAPMLPVSRLEPVDAAPAYTPAMEFVFAPQRTSEDTGTRLRTLHLDKAPAEEPAPKRSPLERIKLAPVATFWRNAPRDLKLLAIALPLFIGLAIQPSLPKVHVTASLPNPEISKVVSTQWNGLRKNILDRAGVELSDDFRSGLDDWQSKSDLSETWSYDAVGFVKPGPLAIYEPSKKLGDYQVQFLGQIGKKALGFAYRATDLDNYYAAKIVIVKPGPLPVIALQRYSVINGRPGPKVEKVLALSVRNDTFYRVRLDVEGEYFALRLQGHLVDFWSDSRWKTGGVGFFNAPGEESRIRWVQVSHQYDTLGRLCAYLSPYGVPASPAAGLKD